MKIKKKIRKRILLLFVVCLIGYIGISNYPLSNTTNPTNEDATSTIH